MRYVMTMICSLRHRQKKFPANNIGNINVRRQNRKLMLGTSFSQADDRSQSISMISAFTSFDTQAIVLLLAL